MRTRIRVAVVVALVLVPLVLWAQYQPWAVQWLQRANTADNGRNYLGVSSSLATSNLVWVTSNALYSIGASAYVKKAGDIMSGPLTNQIVDPSYLDNLVISNLTVIAGGLGWNGTTNVFDKYGLLMRIPFYPLISFEQTGQATHPALPAQVLRYGDNLYYGTFYNSFLFSDLVTFGGVGKGTSFWAFSDAYFRSNSIILQTNFSGYSVASSGFYGNGAGLTNIPIANITTPGAIVTNGMSSSTTLSNGLVMYGGSNFIAQAHPNTGLLVTNGANYVTITNGAIRTSGSVVAGGQGTFSSTVRGSSFHMSDNVNFYQSSSGVGGVRDGNLANFSKWIWGSTSTNIAFTFPTAVSVPTLTIMDSSSGQANLNLSGTLTTTNGITSLRTVTGTNFTTSAVKWVDVPMNYSASALGPNAPSLTAVTNGSVVQELAFDNNDILYAQGQFQHNVAVTNASFPSFYFEPHVHFTTIGTLDATHSNVTWRCEWQVAAINGGWFSGTNSVTMGVTNNHTHYMAELGHITNNALNISSIFRCRLMRPASVAQDYSNAHDVLLDGFDIHIPVGNLNAIGSSSDNSP